MIKNFNFIVFVFFVSILFVINIPIRNEDNEHALKSLSNVNLYEERESKSSILYNETFPILDSINSFDFEEKQIKNNDNSNNILLLMSDRTSKNTDTIMIINTNFKKRKIYVLSIPRDTKVYYENKNIKINSLYASIGANKTIDVIENLLNISIKNYVHINLDALQDIVDSLGGVDYYVPVAMHYEDPTQDLKIHFEKGLYHFNGDQVEKFLRFRKNSNDMTNSIYDGSDINRISVHHDFIKEFIHQKSNLSVLTKLDDIYRIINKNMSSNISFSEVLGFINNKDIYNSDNIEFITLPGESRLYEAWYYIIDDDKSKYLTENYFK